MFILITGNTVDGHEFYGPFSDSEVAEAWADRYLTLNWWIAGLGVVDMDEEESNNKSVRVTLDIKYNSDYYDHPSDWMWWKLIDLDPANVTLVSAEDL